MTIKDSGGWYYPHEIALSNFYAILQSWHIVSIVKQDCYDVSENPVRWCKKQFGPWLCDDFYAIRNDIGIVVKTASGKDRGSIMRGSRWEPVVSVDEEFLFRDAKTEEFLFRDERDAILFKLRWG